MREEEHVIQCQYTRDGKIVETIRNDTDIALMAEVVWGVIKGQLDTMCKWDEIEPQSSKETVIK